MRPLHFHDAIFRGEPMSVSVSLAPSVRRPLKHAQNVLDPDMSVAHRCRNAHAHFHCGIFADIRIEDLGSD